MFERCFSKSMRASLSVTPQAALVLDGAPRPPNAGVERGVSSTHRRIYTICLTDRVSTVVSEQKEAKMLSSYGPRTEAPKKIKKKKAIRCQV